MANNTDTLPSSQLVDADETDVTDSRSTIKEDGSPASTGLEQTSIKAVRWKNVLDDKYDYFFIDGYTHPKHERKEYQVDKNDFKLVTTSAEDPVKKTYLSLGYKAGTQNLGLTENERVFVKFQMEADSGSEQSMKREIHAYKRINRELEESENFLKLIFAGKYSNPDGLKEYCIGLPYCGDAENLEDLITDKLVDSTYLPDILEGLSKALVELHKKRIFHLDIKPKNIIYQMGSVRTDNNRRPTGQLTLIDFGTAVDLDSKDCPKELGVVTGCYAAPEVLLARFTSDALLKYDIDGRADSFSVGQTAFHIIRRKVCHPPAVDREKSPEHNGKKLEKYVQDQRDEIEAWRPTDKERSVLSEEAVEQMKKLVLNLLEYDMKKRANTDPFMLEVQRWIKLIDKSLDVVGTETTEPSKPKRQGTKRPEVP